MTGFLDKMKLFFRKNKGETIIIAVAVVVLIYYLLTTMWSRSYYVCSSLYWPVIAEEIDIDSCDAYARLYFGPERPHWAPDGLGANMEVNFGEFYLSFSDRTLYFMSCRDVWGDDDAQYTERILYKRQLSNLAFKNFVAKYYFYSGDYNDRWKTDWSVSSVRSTKFWRYTERLVGIPYRDSKAIWGW